MNTNPHHQLNPELVHVALHALVADALETHRESCEEVPTSWSETLAGMLEWDDREGLSTDTLFQINNYQSPFAEMSWAEVAKYTRAAYDMMARVGREECAQIAHTPTREVQP